MEAVQPANDGRRQQLLGCPHCAREVSLRPLITKEDRREFGCGQVVPLIAVCQPCQVAWSMETWRKEKAASKRR